MRRITKAHLEAKVAGLNDAVGAPPADLYPTAGRYYLDGAYGGWALYLSDSKDVFNVGHVPARELAGLISAFLAGYWTRAEQG